MFSQMCSAKQIHFLFHDYTQPRQWSENYILFQVTLPNIIWSLSIIHGILHVILFPSLSGNTVLWFWGLLKFLRDMVGSEINGKWLKISCVAVFIVGKLVEMWVRGMQAGIRSSNKFSSASLLATYPVTVWHYKHHVVWNSKYWNQTTIYSRLLEDVCVCVCVYIEFLLKHYKSLH